MIREEVSRKCFLKFIPAINLFRSFCGFIDLNEDHCPETIEETIDWLDDHQLSNNITSKHQPHELKSLLSEIRLDQCRKPETKSFSFKPSALKIEELFPLERNRDLQINACRLLYKEFVSSLRKIPSELSRNWSVWLDHFESAWMASSLFLPSGCKNALEGSVSLFDASKVEAAGCFDSSELMLIQGDFQGIQNFIFTEGAQTNRYSSKLLRGRSFYVSLISELAALRISNDLNLPTVSPLINAAGKFLICAPYTQDNCRKLDILQNEFNEWFLTNTLGTVSLVISQTPVKKEELKGDRFDLVMKRVFAATERAKLSAFHLNKRHTAVLDVDFSDGVSPYDARLPARSKLSRDEIDIGEWLVKSEVILVSDHFVPSSKALSLPIFGFFVRFENKKALDNSDFQSALRLWDISLIENPEELVFKGIAKRFFNSYVARFTYEGEKNDTRYASVKQDNEDIGEIKPFGFLACENSTSDGVGIIGLGALKGDVDNLGLIFREGILNRFGRSTAVATLNLSRQVNTFFALYLPVLFARHYSDIYTVFAGGDDFFLIGPWHDIFDLATKINQEFDRYCCNSSIHFSAGISVNKPSVPIRALGRMTEKALEASKESGKNRVTAYGITVPWSLWSELSREEKNLNFIAQNYDISGAYFYRLLDVIALRAREKEDPLANVWRARLYYSTIRFIKDKNEDSEKVKSDFLPFIVGALDKYGEAFTIPLFNSLYSSRKRG